VQRYVESFADDMDEIHFEGEQLFDAGESVVVDALLTAKGRQTGIPVEQRSAGVLTVRDGKLIRLRAYVSLSEALKAVGLI
jgi:ketosteroid isomerase-like protein